MRSLLQSKIIAPATVIAWAHFTSLAWAADTSGWREIKLGGETSCSDGSPYSIFIHDGTSGNLVIDFQGGGACWNSETCRPGSRYFTSHMPDIINEYIAPADGIYNRKNLDNPFRRDTHVLIPYCTGDIHWGRSDETYDLEGGETVAIRHRGAINAQAALDETIHQLAESPQKIFVTGCSAGAYGSIWWTPYIRKQHPNAKITQFGDSGASIMTETFRNDGISHWHIERSAPSWIPELDPTQVDLNKLQSHSVYKAIADANPDIKFSQFNYLNDVIQRFFYNMMGGQQSLWAPQMRATMSKIGSSSSNFNYYTSPWDGHCVLPFSEFYSHSSPAETLTPFKDWLSGLLDETPAFNEPCIGCTEEP